MFDALMGLLNGGGEEDPMKKGLNFAMDPTGLGQKITGKSATDLAGKAIDPLGLSEKLTGQSLEDTMLNPGGGLTAMSGAMEKNPELAAMAMGPVGAAAAPTMMDMLRKKR